MKNLVTPKSLLLYLLGVVNFFFAGLLYAGLTDAAKGQGLAGGATVIGYGVMFAAVALVVSVVLAALLKQEAIRRINHVMLALFLLLAAAIAYRVLTHQGRNESAPLPPTKPTAAGALFPGLAFPSAAVRATGQSPRRTEGGDMGIGFFKPDFHNSRVLYFHGAPNWEKSVQEHARVDSVLFRRTEHGAVEIISAPPWLVPAHLKMDYDILYFNILDISGEFAKVVVNSVNRKVMYVSRHAGTIIHWPDFLLSVHSVEFPPGREQTIRYKPFHEAAEVRADHAFMQPLAVERDWMLVRLVDERLRTLTTGWIQWQCDGELLVSYSLLS